MREQNLDRIARENVEIHIEKEAVQNVEFNQLFTDNLPQKAIDLGQYVAGLKDKDNNGEAKTAMAL